MLSCCFGWQMERRINRERDGVPPVGGCCLAKKPNNQLIVDGDDRGGIGEEAGCGQTCSGTLWHCFGRLIDQLS
jgi:hypothetical protein